MDNLWMKEAHCKKIGTHSFFSEPNAKIERLAKATCRECPVKDQCLEWALEFWEQGVWGGTTDKERLKIRRSRGVESKSTKARNIDIYLKDLPPHGSEARRQMHYRSGEKACQVCCTGTHEKSADEYWGRQRGRAV